MSTENVLAKATNLYGPLDPATRGRIRAFVEDPSATTWEEVYSIVICRKPKWVTLWQAALKLDSEIKRAGKGWEKIPSPLVVLRAIQIATAG